MKYHMKIDFPSISNFICKQTVSWQPGQNKCQIQN